MTQRTERLKAKLFEVDDRALFLERMEIIKECDEKYKDYTRGLNSDILSMTCFHKLLSSSTMMI